MTTIHHNTPDLFALSDVHGPVLRPTDDGYAAEVTGFNLAARHTPDVVVGATGTDDDVAAMRWAAATRTPVTVQATGPGVNFPVDDGLLISTARMTDVRVDPAEGTATVAAGARWRHVLDTAAPHGFAALTGTSTDIGAVGYTLGGGLPVLGRVYGYAADRVRSFRVVTPDGTLHHTDASQEPDLFWALRGGKGNVGVVTSLTCELLPLTRILGGAMYCAGENAERPLRAWADWTSTVPAEMCTAFTLLRLPPLPTIPEPLRGRFWSRVAVAWTGDPAEGERLLAGPGGRARRVRHGGEDGLHRRGPDLHGARGPPAREGVLRTAAGAHSGRRDRVPGTGRPRRGSRLPSADRRAAPPGRPVGPPRRGRGRDLRPRREPPAGDSGVPAVPETAGPIETATAALHAAMAPYGTGRTMVNIDGRPGDESDRARAWTPEVYARLRRTKSAYDPANLLRYGHTVTPPAA